MLLEKENIITTEPLLVGADIGTTNVKVVAFDLGGRVVSQASTPTPTHYPKPTWAYHNPEKLWVSFVTALRKVTSRVDTSYYIASIAIASFSEAAVPLDSYDQPTNDIIAWFDQRTQPQAEWLDHKVGRDHLFDLTGLSLQPIFGLCKLLWLKENEPDAFDRTTSWLNVADYIAFRLSGVRATDYSLASRTLALDLSLLRWSDALLEHVNIPSSLLAPLRPSGSHLGPIKPEIATLTGLPKNTEVAVGGHDHVCGALAAGVTESGTMLNSLGTTEAIFLPVKQPLADPEVGRQGYTQGAHVAGGYYVLGGQYTSGASIDWFREAFGSGSDYETLITEADEAPMGSLGVFFLPHLRLANPPYDDPKARGAFIGLSTDARRGTIFRAVLEGLAFESRNSLDSLLGYSGVAQPQSIYAIGGGAKNQLLMRIKATILGRRITVVGVNEATSLGAALLGGVGAGTFVDIPSALENLRYTQASIDPDPEQISAYDARFREVYQQIYPTSRALHHAIYKLQVGE